MAEKSMAPVMHQMIVILGATGDLTKRKLIPALYDLYRDKILLKSVIVCVGRRDLSKEQFVKHLELDKFKKDAKDPKFLKTIEYVQLDFEGKNKKKFSDTLNKIEAKHKTDNRVFYLSLPAGLFEPTTKILQSTKRIREAKVAFEKPYGHDLASAKKLQKVVSKTFKEEQVYRVDHYLAKELVENLIVFRFGNTIFEQVWNKDFVDHVQITVAENLGVEERAGYYDKAGALRDMIQNHVLQVVALTAMEKPKTLSAEDIRDRKVAVFKDLQRPKDIVLGQYSAGKIDGKKVVGYTDEKNIPKTSKTETYAALKMYINNDRWKGVPFYVRTGKRLAKKVVEINLVLKEGCDLFCKKGKHEQPNIITIRVQPNEGIAVQFNAKQPGHTMDLQPVTLEYCHSCQFVMNTPGAYEHILYDLMLGDHTLFTRWDGVEAMWKYVDPIIKSKPKLVKYESGSMGPKEADSLMEKKERHWIVSKDILK